LIETFCPATFNTPDRSAPAFAATDRVTVPAPVPLELPETVTKDGASVTLHGQV
jgi:hypothetical protein